MFLLYRFLVARRPVNHKILLTFRYNKDHMLNLMFDKILLEKKVSAKNI